MLRFTILVLMLMAPRALAQGYVCAEGGGNPGKGAWADEVFGWMVEKGKHGPAIIIGAIALDAADQPDNRIELFKKLGAADCTALIIDEKNADTQEIYDQIAAASIVFIRGGAQERYVNWWKGTKTEKAIHAVFDKGGVVGGTSAGCAILGEVSYDSKVGSLKPLEALQDARHPHLTLTTDFLGLVPGVLFDTHFTERGRIGRLPVMLATAQKDMKRDLWGLGVDPRTAVCVAPDGTAEIKGEGAVTLLWLTPETKIRLEAGQPPSVTNIAYRYLPPGTRLNIKNRAILPEPPVLPHWNSQAITETVVIRGGVAEDLSKTGGKGGDVWAWDPASSSVPELIAATQAWDHPQQVMRAVQAHLANQPRETAIVLGAGASATCAPFRRITIQADGEPASSALVITARPTLGPPLKSVGRAVLHVLSPGWTVDLTSGNARPASSTPESPGIDATPKR